MGNDIDEASHHVGRERSVEDEARFIILLLLEDAEAFLTIKREARYSHHHHYHHHHRPTEKFRYLRHSPGPCGQGRRCYLGRS